MLAVTSQLRVIAYVDGFNLYFGLKESGWRRYMWLNILSLSERLVRPDQEIVQVRYFTSRIKLPADKAARQDQYLQALESLSPRVSIHYGKYLASAATCRNCGHSRNVQSEKMTDVNVAVNIVEDAFLDRFDTAILVSGDSDLCPPIHLIRRLFRLKRIVVAFPPSRHSNELKQIAHASFTIGESKFRRSQFENPLRLPGGFPLHRPKTWG